MTYALLALAATSVQLWQLRPKGKRALPKPLRQVVSPHLRAGQTILANFHLHWWELDLDCGHTVERRCRYGPRPDGRRSPRGWAAMHRGPGLDRLLDAPKRARCELCPDVPSPGD